MSTAARSLAASGSSLGRGCLSRLGDERALGFADGGVRRRRLRGRCLDLSSAIVHTSVLIAWICLLN